MTRPTIRPGPHRRVDRVSGRCRVLLVEPTDADAQRILALLDDADRYSVTRARSVLEAHASKAVHRPDVVLLDITDPDEDGHDIIEAIPSFSEDAPVIVLANEDHEGSSQDILPVDAHDMVFKNSVTREILALTIRYARERYRFVRAHHRTENRFRSLVDDIPDPVLVADMQGELLHSNPPATALFPNLKPGELVAATGLQVPGPQPETFTLDDQRPYEVRCNRIEWEGRPAWLVLLRDASLRAQVAELRDRLAHSEKLAGIGELAAGVAHEINNPLAFILANLSAALGHVHLIQDVVTNARTASTGDTEPDTIRSLLDQAGPELFAELREILEDNLDGVDRIRTIVRELRTFSRRESEERELVRINDMVKSACHMLASMIRHRATLVKDLGSVPPVMGNRVKLTQIVTNLLMNAIQALPAHRGREERIEVRSALEDRWVVVTVSDTGTGIDDSVKSRIFEPFFTTKPREIGTGIGLSLSAELARQHDGDLRLVETSPDGSTFELRLPATESVRLVRPPPEPRAAPASIESSRTCRVLLIDDEPNVRKSMMRMLREFDVTAAGSGQEALTMMSERDFDVVICDLVMPDLDGVDVHDALSSVKPDLLDRVIYTSGGAYTPRTANFVAKNDILFVEKPVHPKRLVRMIEEVLSPR